MIEVIYYREHNRVTMDGHADTAPIGEDIVCAAASILARTLAANVNHLVGIGAATAPVVELQEGHAEISCKANHKYRSVVQSTFEAVCVGFEILHNGAEGAVRYLIRG